MCPFICPVGNRRISRNQLLVYFGLRQARRQGYSLNVLCWMLLSPIWTPFALAIFTMYFGRWTGGPGEAGSAGALDGPSAPADGTGSSARIWRIAATRRSEFC